MKKFFTTLILIFGVFIVVFAQSQELNTIYTTLVGPENVNNYYDEQIIYYQDSFKELREEVLERLKMEKEFEKKIKEKEKIKNKDKRELKEIETQIVLLEADLMAIEEFSNYWKEFEENEFQKMKNFTNNYKVEKCYLIREGIMNIMPNEYNIEIQKLDTEISWDEMVQGELEGNDELGPLPPNQKWVKRKPDKNCQSIDPNDCLVWAIVEVPEKGRIYSYKDKVVGCPEDFEFSFDNTFCTREITVKGESRDKIALKNKSYPYKEIRINQYSVIYCKN